MARWSGARLALTSQNVCVHGKLSQHSTHSLAPSTSDIGTQHGWTALHWAAWKGRIGVVETLVAHGADTESQNDVRAHTLSLNSACVCGAHRERTRLYIILALYQLRNWTGPHAYARACTHTQAHARTHARTLTHTHIRTHARAPIHPHPNPHPHAHTIGRAHARTHGRTHRRLRIRRRATLPSRRRSCVRSIGGFCGTQRGEGWWMRSTRGCRTVT
jgi:hypothetical protein